MTLRVKQKITIRLSAGFPYRLGRLKPRASTSRGPLAKVYNIFVIVIDRPISRK